METPREFLPKVAEVFLPRDFGLEHMPKDRSEPPQFAP